MNRKPAVITDFTTEWFVVSRLQNVISTPSSFGGPATLGFTDQPQPSSFNFGIALSVTPMIRDDDLVRLWLNPEIRTRVPGADKTFTTVSDIGGSKTESSLSFPTTKWQAIWTNVLVHDGDTLVLGGLIRDTSAKGEQRMPYVSSIPVIGGLFRGKKREVSQSSLLIFVTPDIIDATGARFFDIGSS